MMYIIVMALQKYYLRNVESIIVHLQIMHMNTLAKIAIATAAGVVAGGILGILFAPDKGVNTRKKITDSGKKFTDNVKEKMNELKVNIKGKTDAVKEGMEEFA